MKEKELGEPVMRVPDTIEKAGDERQRRKATEADVVHMFAEELAEELRFKWKEQLDSDLRDRARRGFFRRGAIFSISNHGQRSENEKVRA
jgi:hypothetical protein